MNSSDDLDLWWLQPGVVAGMSAPFVHPERHDRPNAGLEAFQDDLPLLWRAGVRAIVCLLNMPSMVATYAAAGFATHFMPIEDGHAPPRLQYQEFLRFFAVQRGLGHPIAVHCAAGIGRTGVVLAGLLVLNGTPPDEAVLRVRTLRRGAVETMWQVEFLRRLPSDFARSA